MTRLESTMFDKVWDTHVVRSVAGEADLLYIDLHLVQEVSSPHALGELRRRGLPVRRPDLTLAITDHSVPTRGLGLAMADNQARLQVQTLADNCAEFGIELYGPESARQGIVQ